MTNQTLMAVPLFVLMGVILERSKIAEDLLDAMTRAFGRAPGGLGLAVCLVGHAHGGKHRHCRCHGRYHGANGAANDAQSGLQP